MTLLDVEELTRYWIDNPPLKLMVAAYLGVGQQNTKRTRRGSRPSPRNNATNSDIGALLAELGPSFSGGEVHAGLAPVVLDFAELKRKTATAH